MNPGPFTPCGATVNQAVSASSARVQLSIGAGGGTVRVLNSSTNACWVAFGDVTVTAATASSMPMIPNSVEVFGVGSPPLYLAVVGVDGTVYATPGDGN